jgi:ATP-dependent Lon protease
MQQRRHKRVQPEKSTPPRVSSKSVSSQSDTSSDESAGVTSSATDGDRDEKDGFDDDDRRSKKQLGSEKRKAMKQLQIDLEKATKEYESYESEQGGLQKNLTLRERLLLLKTDKASKMTIMRKYDEIYGGASSDPGNMTSENSKAISWLNACSQLPFGKIKPIDVHMSDGEEQISTYLEKIRAVMDASVFGHDSAKEDILCFVARMIANPTAASGKVLALWGPAGCGKTRLVRQAMEKGLRLPFHAINCGGMSDASILLGHHYTYMGSKPGLIAHTLASSGYMNSIIYFDEVDKLSGKASSEISGVLTHLLDPEQNTEFQDNYFQGINLDVSHVLFILSFNDIDKVDYIARDRMKIIRVYENTPDEKAMIIRKFIIPEVLRSMNIPTGEICFTEQAIQSVITKANETGMRKSRRIVETVLERINLLRLIGIDNAKTRLKLDIQLEFAFNPPISIDEKLLDLLAQGEELTTRSPSS